MLTSWKCAMLFLGLHSRSSTQPHTLRWWVSTGLPSCPNLALTTGNFSNWNLSDLGGGCLKCNSYNVTLLLQILTRGSDPSPHLQNVSQNSETRFPKFVRVYHELVGICLCSLRSDHLFPHGHSTLFSVPWTCHLFLWVFVLFPLDNHYPRTSHSPPFLVNSFLPFRPGKVSSASHI